MHVPSTDIPRATSDIFLSLITKSRVSNLLKLYIFAENLCINELANRIMNRVRFAAEESGHTLGVTIAFAPHIYRNTSTDSPLKKCIHDIAFRLWDPCIDNSNWSTTPGPEHISHLRTHCHHQQELLEDFFKLLQLSPAKIRTILEDVDAESGGECIFHRHDKDEACYTKYLPWAPD